MILLMRLVIILLNLACLHGYAKSPVSEQLPADLQHEIDSQFVKQRIAESKLYLKAAEMEQARTAASNLMEKEEAQITLAEQKVRSEIFNRQLVYHPIILCVVILIVLAGVFLSALQALRDLRSPPSNSTSLKLSAQGLEVSSAVVGLVTLTMSFAFFYIYVLQLYPVTIAPGSKEAAAEEKAGLQQPAIAEVTPVARALEKGQRSDLPAKPK